MIINLVRGVEKVEIMRLIIYNEVTSPFFCGYNQHDCLRMPTWLTMVLLVRLLHLFGLGS